MFKRFALRAEVSRQRDQRKKLVTAVAKLILQDTDRVIDAHQMALESSMFAIGAGSVEESHYVRIRDVYGIADPLRTAKGLTSHTLTLLQEKYSADPSGINQLVRDARTAVGDKEIFYRERLMYPVDSRESNVEISRTYREARYALKSKDMSTLPVDQHSGVMAVLKVGVFWGEHLVSNQLKMSLRGSTTPPQELVDILLEMPDRVEDIIDYIRDHRVDLADIAFDHLRDTLTTDSRPFGVGVL